ncbi:hypothetical protein QTH90_12235 [Variovorax sp. J2P1-59]|uniref:hypothetical protein n=1 Tax=Variovorax flavidus TaxID=3053501 RepID=UPI0025789FD2|nr:hypothetical protein [Variovorax sp. J2P1-59]MDM0075157.1 hypothetical protein [Variovorax sp. J2P1-59]
MIRFIPDDIVDGLLRPFAMALPDANIYAEIRTPDVRFALIVMLALIYLCIKAKNSKNKPDLMGRVLAYFCVTFVAWLMTSGNGRYYLPILVLAGPVCVALLWRLPLSMFLKGSALALVLVVQIWLIGTAQPLRAWALADWDSAPPFSMELPEAERTTATFLTLATPSYSIIAPSFPADSRWVNLSFLKGAEGESRENLQRLLRESIDIKTIYPNYFGLSDANGHPPKNVISNINHELSEHHLNIASEDKCRPVVARAFGPTFDVKFSHPVDTVRGAPGFWLCDTKFDPSVIAPPVPDVWPQAMMVSREIESKCSRFFKPGGGAPTAKVDLVYFDYPDSDMRLYVYRSGEVAYKYYNELNPVVLRKAGENSIRLDCTRIRRTFFQSLFGEN